MIAIRRKKKERSCSHKVAMASSLDDTKKESIECNCRLIYVEALYFAIPFLLMLSVRVSISCNPYWQNYRAQKKKKQKKKIEILAISYSVGDDMFHLKTVHG